MTASECPATCTFDPNLDLRLDRVIDVQRELVWRVWTEVEHLKVWFCPRPWCVSHAELDVRPGGRFHTVMKGPEGEEFPGTGCYLEVVPNERLSWTSVLLPDYRPNHEEGLAMTAVIELFDAPGGGTRYVATALHSTAEAQKQHEEMGFSKGWGAALDQLVAHASTLI